MAALFGRAQQIAAAMGVELQEGSTGGGSDGNFTPRSARPRSTGWGPKAKAPTPRTSTC